MGKYKADPNNRPEPKKGMIDALTAASAETFLPSAMGRDLTTLTDLANPKQEKRIDELSEHIVQKHNLGEETNEYLAKELNPTELSHINMSEDIMEIRQQRKQAAEMKPRMGEPQKTVTEPEKTQDKGRRTRSVQ